MSDSLDEMLRADIIKPSFSPWCFPIVLVDKKPDASGVTPPPRICVDYRKLNSVTKADRFPMPNMNDLVFSLRDTQYFTTLDLVKGYYQVPLDPESSEYTAFSTPNHHHEFRRLSFGLKNVLQRFSVK